MLAQKYEQAFQWRSLGKSYFGRVRPDFVNLGHIFIIPVSSASGCELLRPLLLHTRIKF